jgi:hypothetical protein
LPATLIAITITLFDAIAVQSHAILFLAHHPHIPFAITPPSPLSSLLPASLIAISISYIVAIVLVAVASLPPSSPLPSLLLPSPSLLHDATLIANNMALAALALFVTHHLHSPSPLLPLPSLLLPSTSAACSRFLSSPAIVVLLSSMLSCQPPPPFDTPIAS